MLASYSRIVITLQHWAIGILCFLVNKQEHVLHRSFTRERMSENSFCSCCEITQQRLSELTNGLMMERMLRWMLQNFSLLVFFFRAPFQKYFPLETVALVCLRRDLRQGLTSHIYFPQFLPPARKPIW